MKKSHSIGLIAASLILGGCARIPPIRANLSAEQIPSPLTAEAFINTLMEPIEFCRDVNGNKIQSSAGVFERCLTKKSPGEDDIKRYLTAGFGLSDIYCDSFFRNINLTHRSRRFSRSLTNDAGTLIQTVLGLSSASKGVITGIGAGFGAADSSWRNYDDAFMVSPNLDVVRTLVLTAQDDYRASTYVKSRPTDFATARSTIIRYAGFCSFLGMQSLLNKSIEHQTSALKGKAEETSASTNGHGTGGNGVQAVGGQSVGETHNDVSSSVVPTPR